ncbi:MAG: hypothetical protein K0R50_140 [Eubacterium sp.]|nr:hypothetical protein [Eubacterium sp.]
MEIVTYTLRKSQPDSDMYYSKISGFTDKVLLKAAETLKEPVELYLAEIKDKKTCPEEGVLELLILGVRWNSYIDSAGSLGSIPAGFLKKISEHRQEGIGFKWGINYLKGIFSTIFLIGKKNEKALKVTPDLSNMDKLLTWLQASGEFKQEVKHLELWRNYLSQIDSKAASKVLSASIAFAQWFQGESLNELDIYTPEVEQYLESGWPEHKWKEDVIFCGRKKVDYHLNMVGAEIMNRIYRNEFLSKAEKVLLIPTCMRKPHNSECMAKQLGKGFVCSRCTRGCPVYVLSEIGQRNNLKVRMIPHESSIASTKTDKSLFDTGSGVIGVSCVLNLISGGWMLADKGVAPQCVLLDYCGCKNHWHDKGLPTELNEKQLMKILGVKTDRFNV